MNDRDEGVFAKPLASASEGVALASDSAAEPPTPSGWRDEARDGPMPMRGVPLKRPVPDLGRIDRSRWREILGSIPRSERVDAAASPGAGLEALELALSLPPAPSELARQAVAQGPSLSMPEVRRVPAPRQVNVRLQPSEFEDLQVTARLLGLTPTQVARMCITTGVRRAIADHDAALERLRR